MLKAAQEALAGIASPPQLLAVTVLTSMDQAELHATGHARTPEEQVIHLAKMGLEAGMCGFVCSPQEVATVRALTGPKGILVTPGIRPSGAELSDQRRVATPAEALSKGASYVVVGGRLPAPLTLRWPQKRSCWRLRKRWEWQPATE